MKSFQVLLISTLFLLPGSSLQAQLTSVFDTVLVNESAVFCPPAADYQTAEILFTSSDDGTDFFLSADPLCLEYAGIRSGQDSASVRFCRNDSDCDTFLLIITVRDSPLPPALQDDQGQSFAGQRLILAPLDNDQLNAPILDFGLLETGRAIAASLQGDRSLSYFTPTDECDFTDELRYFVCTATGCDTAFIRIEVLCPEVTIYNAVSPNGDGLNDVFFVEGIEFFPESKLYIFNAYGSEVFRSTGYENDWDGTTSDGRLLPAGTYYYRMQLNSELGPREELQGYIELQR